MSYKGYDGVDIFTYPYNQFKTWKEVWTEATWDEPVGPMRGRPKPKIYRESFSDYDTAADAMEPNSVGVYGTGANRTWIVAIGYSSEWWHAQKKGRQAMKALLIGYWQVRRIDLEEDRNGQLDLSGLQHRVGGYVEPFNMLFENVTLYVNEDGMRQCEPNRLIVATQYMADNLRIEPMSPVTILYGNIIAVGRDPDTGDDRSLTEQEEKLVRGYFHELSKPGSGEQALLR